MRPRRERLAVGLVVVGVVALTTGATDDTTPDSSAPSETVVATTSPPVTDEATGWQVRPGPEQIAVLDAPAGTAVGLVPADGGEPTVEDVIDDQGSVLFRDVRPGEWRVTEIDGDATSGVISVPSLDELPPTSLYTDQQMPSDGFGYLTTRDGTTLSINVVLPGPVEEGPYPTVVEYSGYQPSDPAGATGFPAIFRAMGYAYVGVNMRGTGCSGGSYEFFEPVQSLDGYDAIEAIAAQPWVQDHQVGMVGVSYPGISQLYVAATKPPSLVAITPLSVLDDAATSVLYPGGILNTGFAVEWTQGRMNEAAAGGQAWTTERIADGDAECAANQRLRGQNPDLVQLIRDNPFWVEEVAGPLAPRRFVGQITVPVFLAGAWQDEQTGGRFANMLDEFTGTDHLYVDLVNGLHVESISAGVFPRYVEFLDLYVAERVPQLAAAQAVSPVLSSSIFGTDAVELPPDRFEGVTYEAALAWFEAEPPVRVLFEEGAADGEVPGTPVPRFVESFRAWPIPQTLAQPWYLEGGGLSRSGPTGSGGTTSYVADPAALPATFFDSDTGSVWVYDVEWDWRRPPAGTAAEFVSEPFETEAVYAGSGSADLWIRSSAPDTDLEVTISEIRPDGQEVYIQSGWLRASHRALDGDASTELQPVATHLEADAAELPVDEWTLVRIEIFPFAHVFRPGSQLRLTVDAPGNSRAEWEFETIADGETVEIAWDAAHRSRVVLPLIPGIDVPDEYPACSLRGQPCRVAGG